MEAHFKAFVKFIYYYPLDAVNVHIVFIDVVVHSSWSSKYDMGLELTELTMFIHRRSTTIACIAANIVAETAQHIQRLQSQFASRDNDYRLQVIRSRVYHAYQWQNIGQCLA